MKSAILKIPNLPNVISLAGSDCSSGAGIQADLKTFTALKTNGLTIPTCIVAETEKTFIHLEPCSSKIITQQIKLLLEEYPISAIKIGLIPNPEILETLIKNLSSQIPLIIDPIISLSTGKWQIKQSMIAQYSSLFKIATLITPNLPELASFTKTPLATLATDLKKTENQAKKLSKTYQTNLLIKGGHFTNKEKGTDILVLPTGETQYFPPKMLWKKSPHGTGCILSSAITAYLAQGNELPQAVKKGREYLNNLLLNFQEKQFYE